MRKDSRGFSLIELLIVVAIILIIAAIAIPDMLKAKISANQTSAVGSLKAIQNGEVQYSTTFTTGYSPDLLSLDGPPGGSIVTNASYIDSVLGSGTKSSYTFIYAAPAINGRYDSFTVNANPVQGCGQGQGNCYYTDQTLVIRVNTTGGAATTADSPIGG
jgi:type IV pilus assembly protein PilA